MPQEYKVGQKTDGIRMYLAGDYIMNSRRANLLTVMTLLLFVGYTIVWGWDGPCVDLNNDCGGYGGGMGTCRVEWESVGAWACVGRCGSYCPSNPGVGDQYCQGRTGRCQIRVEICNYFTRNKCEAILYSNPPACRCETPWETSNPCYRQYCIID